MEVITLNEALKEMESGRLFSIGYITYSKSRKTGGEIKELDGCRVSYNRSDTGAKKFSSPIVTEKKPNHYMNRTRNIVTADGSIKKVNIWLIIRLNGKKVTLY